MEFEGRYILIAPASPETLQARLTDSGKHDEAAIKTIIASIPSEDLASEIANKTIINDDLDTAVKSLSDFIYEKDGVAIEENGAEDVGEAKDDEGVKEPAEEMQVDAPAAES